VESVIRFENVTFKALQLRLLKFVTYKVQNGEYTERGLARVLGISQSQIHNVLKGARRLQPVLADRILQKFDIGTADLLSEGELTEALKAKRDGSSPERFWARQTALDGQAAAKKPAGWSESRLGTGGKGPWIADRPAGRS
jgi:plasmid maintenance system antidote protein VapI